MTASGSPEARADHLAPGVALRAARTAQNLSVGEVARQLRLSVKQVEALETSAFERLPGTVFVRGFIRNYARLLKLDPEPLLRSAVPALPEPAAPIDAGSRGEPMPAARKLRWPRYAIAVIGLALVLAAYEHFLAQPSPVPFGQAPDTITVAIPVTSPPALAPAPAPVTAAPTGAEGNGREAVGGVVPDAAAGPGLAPAAIGTDAQGSALPSSSKAEIALSFDRDSWVEIRDQSGNTIFSQLNRRGTEQRVTGTPPLVVVIGSAQGVRLTYNDRRVDLDPHTKHDVARLTLE